VNDLAIETRDLSKVFGQKVAVRNLTLEVHRGEVFGFLGPNGAGKSTSIKMLLGLARPTSGSARLLGRPAGDVRARRSIGFLPEHFRFHDWLTAEELLDLHGRLCGMDRAQLRRQTAELLDRVGLGPHRHKPLRSFSKGMLQRVGLAQALINGPELIFLDEPTSGLDPNGRRLVRDLIRAERDRGTTVFLNSHLLGEVELTCDRVAFLKHGEVAATKNLRSPEEEVIPVEARVDNLTDAAVAGLGRWAAGLRREGDRLSFEAKAAALPEIVRYLVEQGAGVYQIAPRRLSLEDAFLEIVGSDEGL
jgi:ABC-2 type transport system ATP-binding protein